MRNKNAIHLFTLSSKLLFLKSFLNKLQIANEVLSFVLISNRCALNRVTVFILSDKTIACASGSESVYFRIQRFVIEFEC